MRFTTLLGLAVVLLAGGCGAFDDGSAGNRVTVLLTTASSDTQLAVASVGDADHLYVTFGRVDLVPAGDDGGGIVRLDLAGGGDLLAIDAMTLDEGDVADFAGAHDVPPGDYAQIRLIVVDAALWFCDEPGEGECESFEVAPVFVPSGAQTGLKVNIEPPLTVGGEGAYQLTVVFDVDEAIIETPPGSGNYLLKPTAIRVVNESVGGGD